MHEVALVTDAVRDDVSKRAWHAVIVEDCPLGQMDFKKVEHGLEVLAHGFMKDAVLASLFVESPQGGAACHGCPLTVVRSG